MQQLTKQEKGTLELIDRLTLFCLNVYDVYLPTLRVKDYGKGKTYIGLFNGSGSFSPQLLKDIMRVFDSEFLGISTSVGFKFPHLLFVVEV